MESVRCFFRSLFIIMALFIPCILVIVMKVLEWMVKRICACVQRVFEFFNANTAAMQRTEPAITVRISGNGTVPVTSENIESRRVKTTRQNNKNKKPYKEKRNIVTNEVANNGRIPVPFNAMKQARAEGRISSKGNLHRTEKVAPSTTRSLWGLYSDDKNQKGNKYNQERYNGRIKHSLSLKPHLAEENIAQKDSFHKREKVAPSSNLTTSPWRRDSDVQNKKGKNFSVAISNNYDQLKHIVQIKPQTNDTFRKAEKVVSTARLSHPVRLWSVDIDAETATPASDHQPQDCCESNENIAAESVAKDLENITMQTANSEIGARTNKFSCSNILVAAANAMMGFVLCAMQPICSFIKVQLAKLARNCRITQCSCILVAVANVMVGVVFGVVQPVCKYVKARLVAVVNAMVDVVLDKVQLLYENSNQHQGQNGKMTKRVSSFRVLWREIRELHVPITSVITTTVKSKLPAFILFVYLAVSRLRVRKQDNTSQEITRASSNVSKDQKRDKTAVIQDAHQAIATTETVAAEHSYITKTSTVENEGIFLTSQQGGYQPQTKKWQRQKQKSRPLKEKVQLNASLTVGHAQLPGAGERQVKLSTEGKVKDKEASPSITNSSVNESAKVTVGRRKKQKKVVTAANVDLPATTPSVPSQCKTKERAMPRLIPPSYVNMVARAKVNAQDIRCPRVGLSNLLMPSKVNNEPQISSAHNSDNRTSAEIQEVIEHTVSRAKRRNSEQEMTTTNVQASKSFISRSQCGNTAVPKAPTKLMRNPFDLINKTFATVGRPRENIKRKAEGDTRAGLKGKPTVLDSARRTAQVTTQKSDKVTVEQPELMEVGESADMPFTITWPEEMEVCQEPSAVTEVSYKLQAPANTRATELETEEMETVEEQTSLWNFFSLSLPSFLATPFCLQPAEEEMEIVEQLEPVTPSNDEQEEMDIPVNQQPITMTTPFGQHEHAKWPALTAGMGRPEVAYTSPQQETVASQQLLHTLKPVASPFRELWDTKRPLASTVGMFGETDNEQHMMQSVTQRQVMQHVMQPVMQPMMQLEIQQPAAQPAMQPAVYSVMQQPVVQLVMQAVVKQVMQPAMQVVKKPEIQGLVAQPGMQPTVEPKMPEKLLKTAIDPGTLLQSQHPQENSAMESRLNNASSEGQPGVREFTITGQTLTSELRGQEATSKSRDQLIMEQLQLVPPTDPACYLADGSDSDSGDSDDEYELDLETIENFSELESCPDHAQFITKLLIEKESTEWHNVSDSDSDSDCDETHELSELLDSENCEILGAV